MRLRLMVGNSTSRRRSPNEKADSTARVAQVASTLCWHMSSERRAQWSSTSRCQAQNSDALRSAAPTTVVGTVLHCAALHCQHPSWLSRLGSSD